MDDDPFALDTDLPEGDVCRVCRLEGSLEDPLYHPCRCSGSIRDVHSECLVQWLRHSGKKTCELCGYKFGFKKFYPPDMPSSLPPLKLVINVLRDYSSIILLGLRGLLVGFVWLIFLPLTAIFLWRNLFVAGGQAAFWLAGTESDPVLRGMNATQLKEVKEAAQRVVANVTEGVGSINGTGVAVNGTEVTKNGSTAVTGTLYALIKEHGFRAVGRAISRLLYRQLTRPDMGEIIFKGQMIAIGMIVAFLSVFLLREWIFQIGPNPAEPEEVVVQDPPRADEFTPDMAVRWRKARKRDDVNEQIVVGDGVAGLARGPGVAVPQEDPGRWVAFEPSAEAIAEGDALLAGEGIKDVEHLVAPDIAARQAAGQRMGTVPRTTPGHTGDDEAWEDIAEDYDVPPEVTKRMKEDRLDDAQRERLRQARARYFEVPDHNREFGALGEHQLNFVQGSSNDHLNAEAGPSNYAAAALAEPAGPRRSPRLNKPVDVNQPFAEDELPRPKGADIPKPFGERWPLPPGSEASLYANAPDSPREAGPADDPPVIPPVAGFINVQEAEEEVVEGPEPVDDDDEFDDIPPGEEGGFIMEGDLDGILAAIGMQGPPVAILQNLFLVNVVLASALVVLIHLPYIIGKTHLLADINIIFAIIRVPIRLIRLITDPVIDVLIDIVDVVILQSIGGQHGSNVEPIVNEGQDPSLSAGAIKSFLQSAKIRPAQILGWSDADLILNRTNVAYPMPYPLSLMEDQFAQLGAGSNWAWQTTREAINDVGLRDTPVARTIATLVGYVDVLLAATALVAYGERFFGENGKFIAQTIAEHSDLFKLGVFMAIELVFFPLAMGYCLDFCTLPLFPDGTLRYRLEAHSKHQLLGLFGHWLCGTHFMFAFAKFLAVCRSVCRRGAMYIIRDPADPNFSPVKDILSKKSLSQLYKLCVSAGMYLSVLGGPLGGILWLTRYQTVVRLLPLRWAYQTPLTQIPVDVILLLFVIPHHMRKVRLDHGFKLYCRYVWTALSRALRLSSYMRGVRYPHQEKPGRRERVALNLAFAAITRIRRFLRLQPLAEVDFDGGLMRVPYADQVILVLPRKGVFIRVDDQGIPLTDEGKIMAVTQDRAARKARRAPRQDYCMVYLPAFYRLRFWIFGIMLWTAISASLVMLVCIPVGVGRAVLSKLYIPENFHDGYSFIVGGYILNILAVIGWHAGKHSKSVFTRFATTPRYRDPWTPWKGLSRISSAIMRAARRAYVIFTVMLCMPIGVGVLFELYVLQPIKYGFSDMTPVLYPSEAWSYGLMIMSLVYMRRTLRIAFLHAINRHELLGGFFAFALKPHNVNRQLLLPVTVRVLILAIGPAVMSATLSRVARLNVWETALCFRLMYPWTFFLITIYYTKPYLIQLWHAWSLAALEKEYLVEKRVLNMEDHESSLGQSKFPASVLDGGTSGGENGFRGGPAEQAVVPDGSDGLRRGGNVGVDPELAEDQRVLHRVLMDQTFADAMTDEEEAAGLEAAGDLGAMYAGLDRAQFDALMDAERERAGGEDLLDVLGV